MGWLFALSNGLQRRSAQGIWLSLLPIAAGHAASILLVALAVLIGLQFLPSQAVEVAMAMLLLGFGAYKLKNYYRHPRWVGMKIGFAGLFGWSFVMATAHGAGLMVAPILAGAAAKTATHAHHAGHEHASHGQNWTGLQIALAVGLHTLSMLVVMGVVAFVVYRYVGLSILRRGWINFDLIWAVALLGAGGIALVSAVSGLRPAAPGCSRRHYSYVNRTL